MAIILTVKYWTFLSEKEWEHLHVFFFSLKIFIIVLEILRTGDNNWILVVQEAVSVHIKFSFGVQCFSGWIHQSLFELFWSIPVVVLLSPDSCESIPDARSKLTLQLAPSKDRMYLYLVQFSHLVVSNSLWSQGLQQPGFAVHHQLPELAQTHVHQIIVAIQPSHPLVSLSPPAFYLSSIGVFSNRSLLCIRWPKYWSFSFSISPSSEYSGMIYFRIDCFDLLAV